MFRGKNYKQARKAFKHREQYGLREAVEIVKRVKYAKFDETVDLTVNLGVDPKYSDQMVRGTVSLPHGTGKTVRVCVITSGDKVEEARKAGADFVGGVDIVERIEKENWLDFDKVVASPDMMKHVGKLGKVLGPKGLMPNPKVGTVTQNVRDAVESLKKGQLEYRVDKYGIVHIQTGKASFDAQKLYENTLVILNAIAKAKPAAAKGTYMKKVVLSSTMGPGVIVDLSKLRTELEDAKKSNLAL